MHIDPVERVDTDTGRILVRNGVTLAFFLDRLVYERCEEIIEVFDLFIEAIPPGALKWAIASATSERWRAVDDALLQRMRASLRPPGAKKRGLTGFRVNDSAGSAPEYSFRVLDSGRDKDFPDARTLVQMAFPPSSMKEEQVAGLVELVDRMAAVLRPVSGYCSPGLLTSTAQEGEAFGMLKGIALRHPGYDVEMNEFTQLEIGNRVRGARWITLLGPFLAQQLGGVDAIRAALPPEVDVRESGGVVVIQAGRTPEVGDRNRKQDLPLLRAVARLLEPVTLFGEGDLLSYFANFDEDVLRRWERRFLD
jgi:hypothetical protein